MSKTWILVWFSLIYFDCICFSTSNHFQIIVKNHVFGFYHSGRIKAQLQRVCGGYLACLEQFQSLVPQKFAAIALVEINKAFLN